MTDGISDENRGMGADAPLSETSVALQSMAGALDSALNPLLDESGYRSTGFCLLVFGLNSPGIANYVSNAQREDMIECLKETVARFENNEDNVRFPDVIGDAPQFVDKDTARILITQAVGEASMCWVDAHKAGEYQSAEAQVIVDALINALGFPP